MDLTHAFRATKRQKVTKPEDSVAKVPVPAETPAAPKPAAPTPAKPAIPAQPSTPVKPIRPSTSAATAALLAKAAVKPPVLSVIQQAEAAIAAADAYLEEKRVHALPPHFEYLCSLFVALDTRLRIRSGPFSASNSQKLDALRPVVERVTRHTFLNTHLAEILGIYPDCFKITMQRVAVEGSMALGSAGAWTMFVGLPAAGPTVPVQGQGHGHAPARGEDAEQRRATFRDRAIAVVAEQHERWCRDAGLEPDDNDLRYWHKDFPLASVKAPSVPLPAPPPPSPAKPSPVKPEAASLGQARPGLVPRQLAVPPPDMSRLAGLPQDLIDRVLAKELQLQAENAPDAVARRQAAKDRDLLKQAVNIVRGYFLTLRKSSLPFDDVLKNLYFSAPHGTFSELSDARRVLALLEEASGGWFKSKVLTLTKSHVAQLSSTIEPLPAIEAFLASKAVE